ncbi:MAG: RluA family pseudouridine synthase [Bacteroidales bacterium]|nr:RluA family pseudouridine synthase [Bacteroidales bacterium]
MGSSKKKNTVKKLADKLSALSSEKEEVESLSLSDEYPESDDGGEEDFQDDENVEELFEHYHFTVDKGRSMMRLDKYITSRMFETSRSRVQMAIEAGYVRVGGKVAKSNYKIKPLDEISLVFPYEKRARDIGPENIPLDIVYEDDDVLVINKKAGMVVHPGHGHFSGTLVNAVAYHLGGKNGILVHRIDKDTSGILVIAKNEEAQMKLAKQFFDHTTKRKYVAIVWGNVEQDEGTIDGNITRDESDRMRFTVSKDPNKGKHAVTHFRVLERFGYVTVVECILETGRTHQIRVHMKHIGHTLFNDERYGGNKILQGTIYSKYKQFIENCFKILPRQGLHAKTLGFVHPSTGKQMDFDSPLPEDMKALIEKMRAYIKSRNDIEA